MAPAIHEADTAAFEKIVKGLERAWNRADGDAYASYFAEDADFVNIFAMHGKGRAAIAVAHDAIFTAFTATPKFGSS